MGLHCRTVSAACPFDVVRLLLRRAAGRGHRPQRSGSPGASPTSAPTSPTSTSSGSAATRTLRDGTLRAADRRATETIKVAGGDGRARSPSARRCTARSSPTCSTTSASAGATAPVDGASDGGDVRRRAGLDRRCSPGSTADAIFAIDTAPGLRPTFRAAAAHVRRCRRRTSSTPTSTATSATRPRAGSRSARSATPAPPHGSWPAPGLGQSRTTGRATSPFDEMPHALRPAGGLHRHGQPGGARAGRRRRS